MRAGILTFQNTNNYGALLQAFALCSTVKRLGHDAELIDYRNPTVTRAETPAMPSVRDTVRHPRSSLFRLTAYPYFDTRYKRFQRFQETKMPLGPRIRLQQEMASRYDAIIVGSDQVWNPDITGGDMTYFLPDVHQGTIRKVSYAASFGRATLPHEFRKPCGEALRRFDAIGVREATGAEIVKSISGRDASVVLDPTLLLTRREWERLAGARLMDAPYVFAYLVAEHKRALPFAKQLARRKGMRLVIAEGYASLPSICIANNKSGVSPEQFLSLIQHADAVVTSSFHGLALSLALGTEVYFSLSDAGDNKNSRLTDLAKLAGIERGCLGSALDPLDAVDPFASDTQSNFAAIEARIAGARTKSLAFLKVSLTAPRRTGSMKRENTVDGREVFHG